MVRKQLYICLVATIFMQVVITATRPMTSLFAEELGASIVQIGIITACYSLTPLFLAVFAGRFTDKFGIRFPLIIGCIGMIISLLIPFFLPSLVFISISQLVLGASQLLTLVAIQSGIGKSVPKEKRDKAIASFSLCASIGLMLGPVIGGYSTEHLGFQHSYFFYSIFIIVLLLFSVFLTAAMQHPEKKEVNKKVKVKDVLVIPGMKRCMMVSMIVLAGQDIFYVYYPLYANSIGMKPSEIGWILMAQGLASVITRIFLSTLVNKFGRLKVLSIFMFFGAIAYGMMPLFNQFLFALIVSAVIGIGLGIVLPLTIIITYNLAPPERTGEVLAIRMAGNRLAQIGFPFLFASISTVTGLGAIFIIQGVIVALGAFFARGIREGEENSRKKLKVS